MRTFLIAAAVALSTPAFASGSDLRPAPGSGGATPAQSSEQAANSQDKADPKICRRIQATESRLGAKKVCLTAQQWKQRDEEEASSW